MATEVEKAVTFLTQAIKEKNPDFDLNPTSPLYDLLVDIPANTIIDKSLGLRDEIIQDRSITNTSMTEEKYDELAANFKKYRNVGVKSIITTRLFFSSPINLSVNNRDLYDAGTGYSYNPRVSVNYSGQDFTRQTNQNLYAIDIDLECTEIGSESLLAVGTTLNTPVSATEFDRAVVVGVKQIGTASESNDELFLRIQRTFGVELPINIRGYANIVSEKFSNEITHIFSAGFSEPEQIRDRVTGQIPRFYARLAFDSPISLNINKDLLIFKFNSSDQFYYKPVSNVVISQQAWTPYGISYIADIELDLDVSAVTDYTKMNSGFTPHRYLICDYLSNNFTTYLGSFSSIETDINDNDIKFRTGGLVDLYIKGSIERRVVSVFVPLDSRGEVAIPEELKPVLKIHSASRANPLEGSDTEFPLFNIRASDPNLRFSSKDPSTFYISPEEAGTTVNLDISCMPTVSLFQRYVSKPGMTNSADDLLIKSFIPAFMDTSLIVSGNRVTEGRLRAAILQYFLGLEPGLPIKVDSLIQSIKFEVPEITIFSDSVVITGWQVLTDGSEEFLLSQDSIYPVEKPELGISRKNVQFILNKVDVTYV